MFESCLKKQNQMKALFASCSTQEMKYEKIIQLGKELPKLKDEDKTDDHLVKGCQSTMFLASTIKNGRIFFQVESDALISAGLAAILIHVYNGETAETVLKCSPTYLEDLGISASLTPNRANGLYSIHLKMKQDALKLYIQTQS